MDIIFACSKEDNDFRDIISNRFDDIEELESFSLSGMEEMILFMVPILSLTVQVVDFVWTHMSNTSKDRFVIINGKKRYFKNYSKDEIVEILQELKNE